MRLTALALILLLASINFAPAEKIISSPQHTPAPTVSQPPVTSTGEVTNPQEPQSKAGQQPTPSDQRGTDEVPLAVKILPTPKGQADIEEEKRRGDEHTANERGLTKATWVLAGSTLLLAFVAGAQLALFFWQLRLIRESLDNARIAAEAAKQGALATRDHAEISRATMISAQRAYVSVRTVFFGRRPRLNASEFEGLDAGFTLRNTGNTTEL